VERPTIDPHRQLPCFYYGLPGTYMMHAFSMTGGMVLRWFRDAFCAQEMSGSRSAGRDPYDALTELAASIAPGAEGLTVLPHFQGAGPPESNPLARGVLYGLSLHHGRAHVIRAILESIAMIVHRMIDAMRAMGIEVSEIRCLGGGAKSSLWCQIKADLNELPVSTMQNTEDAACFGAALLAGAATGVWPSVPAAAQALIRPARRYEPDPGTRDAYRRAYDLYTRAYQALEPVFAAPATAVGRGASMNQGGGS
jgi:xylulokinase